MSISANPEIQPFWKMRFFNFFFNQITQMYQNEKSPILNGQKKSKTSEKIQKIEGFRGTYLIPPF